jgi:hypothetical protein
VKAVEMASQQRKVANEFSETFPSEMVQQWRRMVKEWREKPSRRNPYVSKEHSMFSKVFRGYIFNIISPASKISEARLQLTQGEATKAERGHQAPHKVPASVFVRMGLELEDQQ